MGTAGIVAKVGTGVAAGLLLVGLACWGVLGLRMEPVKPQPSGVVQFHFPKPERPAAAPEKEQMKDAVASSIMLAPLRKPQAQAALAPAAVSLENLLEPEPVRKAAPAKRARRVPELERMAREASSLRMKSLVEMRGVGGFRPMRSRRGADRE